MDQNRDLDPTRMRNQPALRESSGAVWLIVGGVLAALCIVVLLALNTRQSPLGLVGAATCFGLYIAMAVIAFAVRPKRPRLIVLACLMAGIAIAGLVFVYTIGVAEAAAG